MSPLHRALATRRRQALLVDRVVTGRVARLTGPERRRAVRHLHREAGNPVATVLGLAAVSGVVTLVAALVVANAGLGAVRAPRRPSPALVGRRSTTPGCRRRPRARRSPWSPGSPRCCSPSRSRPCTSPPSTSSAGAACRSPGPGRCAGAAHHVARRGGGLPAAGAGRPRDRRARRRGCSCSATSSPPAPTRPKACVDAAGRCPRPCAPPACPAPERRLRSRRGPAPGCPARPAAERARTPRRARLGSRRAAAADAAPLHRGAPSRGVRPGAAAPP